VRPLRFLLTNVSGTVLDTVVLAVFSKLWSAPLLVYGAAPLVAFELAVLNNFTLAYFWVWGDRVRHRPRDYLARLGPYHANAFGVFAGRLVIILALGCALRLPVVVCNLLALLFSGLLSYGTQDRLVFRALAE
jgi:putative flippase GtrA